MNLNNERAWDRSCGLYADVSDKILGLLLASIATVLNSAGIKPQPVSAAVPDGADTTDDVNAKTALSP